MKRIMAVCFLLAVTMLLPNVANAFLAGDGDAIEHLGSDVSSEARCVLPQPKEAEYSEWWREFSWRHERDRDEYRDGRHCPNNPAATPIPATGWLLVSGLVWAFAVVSQRWV